MRKCLIVQFEPRHEEVIPSVIAACNAAGYRPQVLLNRRIRRVRGDVFKQVAGGAADIQYDRLSVDPDGDGPDWDAVLGDDIDFVILNTFNRPKVARWAASCGKPVIALVHNVDQFMGDAAFHGMLDRPDFAFMTLAPHVTSELISRLDGRHIDRFGLLSPFVLTDSPQSYSVSQPRTVVVQGNMSLRTRNYQGLINALVDHPGRWDNLSFEFPSSGADRETIATEIENRGLADRMHILPAGANGEVPYAAVFDSLRTATLFHPLIPDGFAQYQRIKITSTASMSVGFGVPMIMDRWSEACYRFPMLTADNTLEASLDRLSGASDAELLETSAALGVYRDQMRAQSGQGMIRLIAQIGVSGA